MTNSHSCSKHLVRFPAFFLVYTIIFFELFSYSLVRGLIYLYEFTYIRWRTSRSDNGKSLRRWQEIRAQGSSYREWFDAATALDRALGMGDGKLNRHVEQDAVVIKISERLLDAHGRPKSHYVPQVTPNSLKDRVADLRVACSPHLGSVGTEHSYRWNHRGTNATLHEFSELTESALLNLLRSRDIFQGQEGDGQRLRLFQSLRQTYGTTALCMSGGASNGYFHLGMVRALLHYGMLPNIITGSSAGSLICACVASRTNAELELFLAQDPEKIASFFQPIEGTWFDWAWQWARTGAAVDPSSWYDKLEHLMGGTWTFAEAWHRTGRDLFICVYSESEQTRVLNWRSTPDVLIASAVIASSALPHIMHGQRLRVKRPNGTIVPLDDGRNNYFDGSLKHDVPLEHLNTQFSQLNCRYTIVSQVEPHILPFFYCPQGSPGAPEIARKGEGLRGGFILSLIERFLKLDMQKYLSLVRDLGLTPSTIKDFDDAFLQKTWGDVTIRPIMTFWDYLGVFSNPTGRSMEDKMKRGAQATYPHLCQISHRHKIEKCLRDCCKEAAAAVVNRIQSVAAATAAATENENDVTSNIDRAGSFRHVDDEMFDDYSLSISAMNPRAPSPLSMRTLSVHESRQIERERDEACALLEQEKARTDYLQQSWDDEKISRMTLEADIHGLSSMMSKDALDIRQRRRRSSVTGARGTPQ